ncbi:Polyketide synthase [Mycena indigotica]|uniref:Polyketide synthase n=1 Tax=Mycena indigotica TaxID=2126181 RepID=A0A8H6SIG8_9AGAR|nr:Polyketide synthase [Mycena indigotica]KAF7299452.1 Polyketide synthase [Mycena indigotica]
MSTLEPIAIVGISVEFPSGQHSTSNLDHEAFFQFLLDKKESYEKFPTTRFKEEIHKGPNLGEVITDVGSFLKDIADFDYVEFGITAKDAKAMAVSTRKLIETTFLALLDSGIDYRNRNVGCYMAAVAFDTTTIGHADELEPRGTFAGYPYMVANKISYHLDLLGPSIPLDTACSSTMTAVHLAVQALRSGDCEAAVVGGCQLNHRYLDFIQYSQGSILAPDGKCKPFDVSANGFSRSEGVGVIVLKPLSRALKEGDHIYASILGTGINNSGSEAPVYAPVASAQIDAMRRAYKDTGRNPTEVDYVELHATGTAAGDPIEANWVGSIFGRNNELVVGSVKGSIG